MRVECQNCRTFLEDSECREAKDLLERHSFGDIFSDLECPKCGALCYPIDWEDHGTNLARGLLLSVLGVCPEPQCYKPRQFWNVEWENGPSSEMERIKTALQKKITEDHYYDQARFWFNICRRDPYRNLDGKRIVDEREYLEIVLVVKDDPKQCQQYFYFNLKELTEK